MIHCGMNPELDGEKSKAAAGILEATKTGFGFRVSSFKKKQKQIPRLWLGMTTY
jgi:hypothetical protein